MRLVAITGKISQLIAIQPELCKIVPARKETAAVVAKAESEQALQTVLQLVQEFGFTAQQVFPWKPQPKKVAAKYRDPNTGATWSGRGKPPQWIAGKDRTPFAID